MLRKFQKKLCYFMMCILLMAGMYTTYVKADSFAERAASIKDAQIYAISRQEVSVAQMRAPEKLLAESTVCVVERVNSFARMVIERVSGRSNLTHKDLRLCCIFFFYALCVASFLLCWWKIEELLCLREKKYRAALIKYIHDIDGKKRISCLT